MHNQYFKLHIKRKMKSIDFFYISNEEKKQAKNKPA